MSLRVQSWVYEYSNATGNDRLVLLAIADEADDSGANAFPSVDRISHKARVPKRTTLRCLERLEVSGDLLVRRPEVRGRGHFNTYVVVMENGATLSPFSLAPDGPEKRRVKARNGADSLRKRPIPIDPQTQLVSSLGENQPEETSGTEATPITAQSLAAAEWERRPTKPVIGFPALRMRIQEVLDAGYAPADIALALPNMSAFSRNAFDFALRKTNGHLPANDRAANDPAYWGQT